MFLNPTVGKQTCALYLESFTDGVKDPRRPIKHAQCWHTQCWHTQVFLFLFLSLAVFSSAYPARSSYQIATKPERSR